MASPPLSRNHSLAISISQLNQKPGPMEVVLFGQKTGKEIEMSVDARYRSRSCSIQKNPTSAFSFRAAFLRAVGANMKFLRFDGSCKRPFMETLKK
jgi:hypothetical protein